MLKRSRPTLYVLLFASWVTAAAQTQLTAGASEPAFETASIRPTQLTPGCFSALPPGGTHYDLTCVTLRFLIEDAYSTRYIDGGGNALDAYYDLRATTSDGIPWTPDTVRPMIRQLLADRFHLVVHTGKRQVSGYAMVVAKGGPRLHSVAADSVVQGQKAGRPSQNFIATGRAQGRGMDSAGIAALLSAAVHAPVVDRTGLTGLFNVDLSFAPDNSTNSNLPSFFTAVEEQLGLKLQPEKVSVDTVVVDHVDTAPTPN